MAKNALAVKEEVETPITVMSDDMKSMMIEDSGKGVSSSHEDNIVPIIYLLQSNSPATKKSQPNYIEGAQAGDIWKRNSIHKALVKGEEGILFQPCFFEKVWVEWRPNRGGLAGVHKERPADAKEVEVQHEGKIKNQWVNRAGNQLVETRQHIGFVDGDEPYVLSFSSTGHTVSRQWMQMMNQQFYPGVKRVAPSWSKIYRLTTVERTKDSNSWFVFKVEDLADAGWVDKEIYLRGKQLHEAFARGEKKASVDEELHQEESHDDVPF